MIHKLAFTVISIGVLLSPVISVKIPGYEGCKVFRAFPESVPQYDALVDLFFEGEYDFWKEPTFYNSPVDIMALPDQLKALKDFFHAHEIPYEVIVEDVGDLIKAEKEKFKDRKKAMDWEDYHTWTEVNTWLGTLVAGSVNSSVRITSESYGTSYEGRDLVLYKVTSGPEGNKPAMWIDATIHAREHITTAVITYIINELVSNSSQYSDILSSVDFYFVPFVNPDGFVYSQEVDRLWRKTRTIHHNSSCIGVDANRNWGFEWGFINGSSGDPCSSGFRGPTPFSEPETKAIEQYILSRNVSWQASITLHSYGQLWLTPWGYTNDLPEDYEDMLRVANEAAGTLKSLFGTEYTVGNSAGVLYATSGSSQDWAKGAAGFKYVYTIELRDEGDYGFLLPSEQIKDTALETWAGIQVVSKAMIS